MEIPPITVDGKTYSVNRKGNRLFCPVKHCRHSYIDWGKFMKHVKVVHRIGSESSTLFHSLTGPSQENS